MLTKSSDTLFKVADSRNKHISEPERLSVFFKPLCGLEGLLVAASRQLLVPCIIEQLAVQKNQVSLSKKFLDVPVPCSSVGVYADVDAFFLKLCKKRKELLCLHGRLST